MLYIAHKLPAYYLNSSRCPLFTAMHCCRPFCQLQYAPLCRSTSTAQLSAVACLCSWTVMARRYWRSDRNRTGKYRYSEVGRPSGPSGVAETTNTVTRSCTFRRSIATHNMKWRPLLYRSPSHQPRQAIAPAQYYNLQCVSQLRATLQFVRNAGNAACVQSITVSLSFQWFVSN